MPSPRGEDRIAPSQLALWALALVAAAVLRFLHLGRQLLAGDELHLVEYATSTPIGRILTTFPTNDPCPPLAALVRWALDQGWTLSESSLRVLPLAAGILLVVVAPLALRRTLGTPAALGLTWLLALSPLLVIYSRIVRPFSLLAALGITSLLALERRWRSPSWRWTALFAGTAALATWLHPLALPFSLAPLGIALLGRAAHARWAPGWRAILAPGGVLAALLAAAYLPAAFNLARAVAHRAGQGRAYTIPALETAELLLGTRWLPAIAAASVLALAGFVHLARARPQLAWMSAAAVLGQVAGCLWSATVGIGNPVVLARYLLIALPVVLLWMAVGVAGAEPTQSARGLRTGGAVLAAVALFGAGPLHRPGLLDSPLLSSADLIGFYRPLPALRPGARIPRAYLDLARTGGADAVLEFTGTPTWAEGSLLAVYQRSHGRPLLFSPAGQPVLFGPGWAWRRFVPPGPEAFLAAPARWLVVHRRIYRELRRIDRTGALGAYEPPLAAMKQFNRQGTAMASELTALWGKPDRDDGWIAVWDLARLRRAPASR